MKQLFLLSYLHTIGGKFRLAIMVTVAFALVVPGKPKRGTSLEFDATVSSTTTDPDPANNHDRLVQRIR